MVVAARVWSFVAFVLLVALTPAMASAADLDLPVKGVVTSGVGWRMDPFGTGKRVFHRGIDIAVPTGTPVLATRKGRVVLAGDDGQGHGATVILEHKNGDRTLYGHNSAIMVRRGDFVEAGAVVALSGNSGRSTGPHVHFELRPGGRPDTPVAEATLVAGAGSGKTAGSDAPEVADVTLTKQRLSPAERRALEQKMDDSINSILKTLGDSALTGHGG